MNELFNQIYSYKIITFQFTGNHSASSGKARSTSSFASGYLVPKKASTSGSDKIQMRSLVSDPVRWHFLYSENGRLEDYSLPEDQMILTLYGDPQQNAIAGTLRNLNWPEPIALPRLDGLEQNPGAFLIYGLDGNGAAVSIAIKGRDI
jgi:hypothetical protein